jgi:ribosome-associated toxin RatA of RatAB toxin-antitoxin module
VTIFVSRAFRCRPWLALLASLPAITMAADGLRVQATRSGTGVAVSAQASIKAPHAVIWATLTDFDRLSEFIPGMKRSRVVGRRGPAAIVEQDGEAGVFFFKYSIRVVVEATEYPPGMITVNVVRGNLKQLEGRYQIEQGATPEEHVLRWTGIIEPDTVLPVFLTVPLIRSNIEDQFTGMVKEIERRAAGRPPGETHAVEK